jgi:hypothetical protein
MAEDKHIPWNVKIIAREEYGTNFCVVKKIGNTRV